MGKRTDTTDQRAKSYVLSAHQSLAYDRCVDGYTLDRGTRPLVMHLLQSTLWLTYAHRRQSSWPHVVEVRPILDPPEYPI